MHAAALIPFLDPNAIVQSFGPWALLAVCVIVFAETGLLIGFIFPGDSLLVITGLLTFTGTMTDEGNGIRIPIYLVALAVGISAFLGGELGYLIGHKLGPRVFERKESGLFSRANVVRTNQFFERFGGAAVILARFVPVVRTFAPIAAGVGHMSYRKYSLYNIIGALLWGAGVSVGGFLLGYIKPLADFVSEYIDLMLLAAVVVAVVPAAVHYIRAARKAHKDREAETEQSDEGVALDQSSFDHDPSNDVR